MMVTRAPKYDLIVLSHTENEVVLGRIEYEYDRKNINLALLRISHQNLKSVTNIDVAVFKITYD